MTTASTPAVAIDAPWSAWQRVTESHSLSRPVWSLYDNVCSLSHLVLATSFALITRLEKRRLLAASPPARQDTSPPRRPHTAGVAATVAAATDAIDARRSAKANILVGKDVRAGPCSRLALPL